MCYSWRKGQSGAGHCSEIARFDIKAALKQLPTLLLTHELQYYVDKIWAFKWKSSPSICAFLSCVFPWPTIPFSFQVLFLISTVSHHIRTGPFLLHARLPFNSLFLFTTRHCASLGFYILHLFFCFPFSKATISSLPFFLVLDSLLSKHLIFFPFPPQNISLSKADILPFPQKRQILSALTVSKILLSTAAQSISEGLVIIII